MAKQSLIKLTVFIFAGVLLLGLILPEHLEIPVQGATRNDWHQDTFWYAPWGKSGVHKGIDIFAKEGTPVLASTSGLVVFKGELGIGGKVVMVLGPKWRLHYFAHLQDFDASWGAPISRGQQLARVGRTGNAQGKPAHLHYAIVTLLPYPWRWDSTAQGWKKMFFLDPGAKLLGN